jgi:hypothetical protein
MVELMPLPADYDLEQAILRPLVDLKILVEILNRDVWHG